MAQKLLNYSRQKRLSSRSGGSKLFARKWLVVLVLILLLALLVLSVLFLQANKAVSDLKSANQSNEALLSSAINSTTKTINSSNIQKSDEANKALAAMTELTTTVDSIAQTCANATKPYVAALAKNYSRISGHCEEITRGAREVRDSLNAFLPLARYQVELTQALAPVVEYHRGDDKVDLDKGMAAWRSTKDSLQKTAPPANLIVSNTAMIDAISAIITELERAKTSKNNNNNAEYKASLSAIEDRYDVLHDQSEAVHQQLVIAQQSLSAAAKTAR